MSKRGTFSPGDVICFLLVVMVYLVGQASIGAYLPEGGSFHYNAPADVDFLYYAGIINQMKHAFPPQNPAFGGVPLSQSFIQYYPTLVLSYIMNPYLAMRVLNFAGMLVLAFVLRRYFPRGWGAGLMIIAAGSVGFGLINSLGTDLIARGFNHFPFFIAFVVAIFERKRQWLRYLCLFLLGWLHSFSALLAFLFFVFAAAAERFDRARILDSAACLLGLASAASITIGVADKPFYFPFVEGFRLDIGDLWMHAAVPLVLILLSRNTRIFVLFGIAFVFGMLFHYNPFFPVFMLYLSGAWAAMDLCARRKPMRPVAYAAAMLLFAGFIVGTVTKYDPGKSGFVPHLDPAYEGAAEWLEANAPADAVLLTAILEPGWRCRLMETRATYLGFIPHVAHLGIDWRERAQKIFTYFRNPSVYMAKTDYVVYGPAERKLFPNFGLGRVPVYRDAHVTIWTTGR